jgi:hypothetical protein
LPGILYLQISWLLLLFCHFVLNSNVTISSSYNVSRQFQSHCFFKKIDCIHHSLRVLNLLMQVYGLLSSF